MRCVRDDQSSVTITLHYLNNGGATMKVRRGEPYVGLYLGLYLSLSSPYLLRR